MAKRAPEKLGDGTRKGELSGLEIWRYDLVLVLVAPTSCDA